MRIRLHIITFLGMMLAGFSEFFPVRYFPKTFDVFRLCNLRIEQQTKDFRLLHEAFKKDLVSFEAKNNSSKRMKPREQAEELMLDILKVIQDGASFSSSMERCKKYARLLEYMMSFIAKDYGRDPVFIQRFGKRTPFSEGVYHVSKYHSQCVFDFHVFLIFSKQFLCNQLSDVPVLQSVSIFEIYYEDFFVILKRLFHKDPQDNFLRDYMFSLNDYLPSLREDKKENC